MITSSSPSWFLPCSLVLIIVYGAAVLAASPTRIDDKTPISKVTPNDGFAYFAGFTEPVNNHPAIYAYSIGGEQKILVLGQGSFEEFPMNRFEHAIKKYKELLTKRGYLPR